MYLVVFDKIVKPKCSTFNTGIVFDSSMPLHKVMRLESELSDHQLYVLDMTVNCYKN